MFVNLKYKQKNLSPLASIAAIDERNEISVESKNLVRLIVLKNPCNPKFQQSFVRRFLRATIPFYLSDNSDLRT